MSSKIDHDGKIVVEPAYKRVVRDANACGLNVKEKQSAVVPSDDHEYACLRVVYEAARRYLRNEAEPQQHAKARDRLEDAIEAVKAIDGGQYEPEADTPSEAIAVVRRTENGSYYIDWLGKQMTTINAINGEVLESGVIFNTKRDADTGLLDRAGVR
jgi:hypothetical protein